MRSSYDESENERDQFGHVLIPGTVQISLLFRETLP
jgi:hypothetical protein